MYQNALEKRIVSEKRYCEKDIVVYLYQKKIVSCRIRKKYEIKKKKLKEDLI